MFELENGNGVLGAVADKKAFSRLVECQRIRLCAEQIRCILPRADRFDDFVCVCVNDTQRITAGVGYDEFASVRGERQRAGMQTSEYLGVIRTAKVNHGNRTFAGNRPGIHPDAHAAPGCTSYVVGIRLASTPIAHINFVIGQHDIIWRHAHVPDLQHATG